ncbi:hypothetical protein C7S14_4687 [Burkholderia cepacia]|nr:hypothetical protein C7S14_4687 [Burkholderia cepacia]
MARQIGIAAFGRPARRAFERSECRENQTCPQRSTTLLAIPA